MANAEQSQEDDDRTPMTSFMLSPSTMGRLLGQGDPRMDPAEIQEDDDQEEAEDDVKEEEEEK